MLQEALKLTADLRKRKQDLLQKQLAQQKLLIERLENSGVAPEQREVLMATIKKLQVSHDAICMGWFQFCLPPCSLVALCYSCGVRPVA
jgi:hypothetical protein